MQLKTESQMICLLVHNSKAITFLIQVTHRVCVMAVVVLSPALAWQVMLLLHIRSDFVGERMKSVSSELPRTHCITEAMATACPTHPRVGCFQELARRLSVITRKDWFTCQYIILRERVFTLSPSCFPIQTQKVRLSRAKLVDEYLILSRNLSFRPSQVTIH